MKPAEPVTRTGPLLIRPRYRRCDRTATPESSSSGLTRGSEAGRPCSWAAPDARRRQVGLTGVPRLHRLVAVPHPTVGQRAEQLDIFGVGPGQRGGGVGALTRLVVVGGGVADAVPGLFGQQQAAVGEALHAAHPGVADAVQLGLGPLRVGRGGVQRRGQFVMAALAGEEGPQTAALAGVHLAADAVVAAGVGLFAVTVVAVAAKGGDAVDIVADAEAVFAALVVVFGQACEDGGRVRGADAVADQFEEAAVDDAVLGRAGLAVVVAQRSLVVGVFVAAEAQEVAAVAPVAGGGEHPRLDLRLIVVGGGL